MSNGRKNIAVLVGHPEEYAHTNFLKGFLEESFSLDYNVMVFAMYVKYQNTQARCKGDSDQVFEDITSSRTLRPDTDFAASASALGSRFQYKTAKSRPLHKKGSGIKIIASAL